MSTSDLPEQAPAQPGGPSRLFILRPVATTLLMVAILLAGLVAYRMLPLSALPEVDYPTIQVTTLYPGASPDVMALTVTSPLERQFGQMPGLTRMTSASSAGASVITMQFRLDLSLDIASAHVTTFGEKAVDVFYVTDLTGKQIVSEARQRTIRDRLQTILLDNDASVAPERIAQS